MGNKSIYSRSQLDQHTHALRRIEQAFVIRELMKTLQEGEQLLGFTRGRIAGGLSGRISMGYGALAAPRVHVALTEKRLEIQFLNNRTGRPGGAKPQDFSLADIQCMEVEEIETFGAEAAARLIIRFRDGRVCRIRLRGALHCESAAALAEVFQSLTLPAHEEAAQTTRTCIHCAQRLERVVRFCPYCGTRQEAQHTEDLLQHSETALHPDSRQAADAAEPGMDTPIFGQEDFSL